jgi:YidC/Oxa1 family membrane protein insertase
MKFRRFFTFLLIAYLLWCTYLILESGLFSKTSARNGPLILLQQTEPDEQKLLSPQTNQQPPEEPPAVTRQASFNIENSTQQSFIIGAEDPNTVNPDIETNFKLQVELINKGAGIRKVTFSDGQGKGFSNRNPKNPEPYVLLSPVKSANGQEHYSMASGALALPQYNVQLPLNMLNWECVGVETAPDGCEKATFIADIKDADNNEIVLRVTKVFDILPNTYVIHCHLSIENLSPLEQDVRFDLNGPLGVSREDTRSDMRKVVAAFENEQGQIVTSQINIRKAAKAKNAEQLNLVNNANHFLWAAVTNKYFTVIAVPVPQAGEKYCKWISGKSARFYNPDGDDEKNSGDETIGIDFRTPLQSLSPAGTEQSKIEYKFVLYLGPKDKQLFDSNAEYKRLGFIYTIDFPACCICPTAVIRPLAFFIVWLMNVLYTAIPNYGVVIIILVFVVRLILHPVTKAGQVRMNRFTKILSSPEVQEIKKKYGKNQMEMQKRISEFQKSRGVSPMDALFGMLPMLVQMPLWIALWSAVNASINLRGAPFLPFWITDLSVPDALISWPSVTIPFLGWKISSLNLLPILMGVAFYFQQKTMPQQAAATPEQQQQQKIMKWMMLLLFPLALYNAPSGVNLYIMASTFAGAIEQYFIRKHIRQKEQDESRGLVEVTSKTGGKVKKKKPKPFFRF